jgi:hypothetical protein
MDTDHTYQLTDEKCYPIGPDMSYDSASDAVNIPPERIRGRIAVTHPSYDPYTEPQQRAETNGQFVASISCYGRLRIDNLGCPEFWLEIDMPELMKIIQAHMYHPEGPIMYDVSTDFKGYMNLK